MQDSASEDDLSTTSKSPVLYLPMSMLSSNNKTTF